MSLIQTSKWGVCSVCGGEEQSVKKRGKELFCFMCCRDVDTKKQVQKANERSQVRGLRGKQKENGLEDNASRANLILDLDTVASRIIRLREADEHGQVSCITCNWRGHWTMADCSHYISRKCLQLRWDLKYNLRPACKKCNQHEYGKLDVFKEKLEQECKGITDILLEQSREVYKPEISELKQLLFDLRQKLKPLEQKITKHANI